MSFEALNIASDSLRVQRMTMDVASRNLTGANEPGYTRQTVVYNDEHNAPSGRFAGKIEGLGTRVFGVQRVRVGLLDNAYRLRNQAQQQAQAPESYLADLEGRLAANPGLTTLLQDLNTSLVQLQGDPGNLGLRQSYFQQLTASTSQIRSYHQVLQENQSSARQDLGQKVDQVNQILTQLADLNPRLVASEANTTGSNGMLDRRDRLLDQLSGLIDVQIMTHPAGDVDLLVGGSQILTLNQAETLKLQPDNSIQNKEGNAVYVGGGAIQALQQYVNQDVPALTTQLNDLASSWIQQANDVHRLAYGLDGVTGRDLLSGTDASNISLALTDPRQLGHAVARIQGTSFALPAFISDQSLSSQAANLNTPADPAGVIEINGVSIAWNNGQSMQEIIQSFSSAGVKASFQPNTGQLLLERDISQPGPSNITVTDISGNLSSMLGLAGQPSQPGGQGDTAGLAAMDQRMRASLYGATADRPLQEAFRDLQSTVGSSLQSRRQDMESSQAAVDSADASRKSVSGVSADEELLNVNRAQQAFAAAAKVAEAANEMLTTLLAMVK